MDNCIVLVAAKYVDSHLSWYIINKFVGLEAAKQLAFQINELVKVLGKHSLAICEGFNIPQHLVFAPIYTGYKEYYKSDITQGEHYNLRAKF